MRVAQGTPITLIPSRRASLPSDETWPSAQKQPNHQNLINTQELNNEIHSNKSNILQPPLSGGLLLNHTIKTIMPTIENTLKKSPLLYFFIFVSIAPILLIGIASQLMGDSSLAPIFNFLSLKHLTGSGGMQSETLKNTAAVTFSYIRLSIPIYFIAIIFLFRRDFAFSNLDLSHFSWKRVTLSLFAIGGMLAFMVYITYFDDSNLESGSHIIRIAATNPILYSILASCHVMMFYFIAHLTFISLVFQPIYLIKNR